MQFVITYKDIDHWPNRPKAVVIEAHCVETLTQGLPPEISSGQILKVFTVIEPSGELKAIPWKLT